MLFKTLFFCIILLKYFIINWLYFEVNILMEMTRFFGSNMTIICKRQAYVFVKSVHKLGVKVKSRDDTAKMSRSQ